MRLNTLRDKAHENAKAKGFYEGEFNFGEKLMLISSELGEALEADRKDEYANGFCHYNNSIHIGEYECAGENEAFKMRFETYLKDTVEDELADALIRIMDLCGYLNIDIEKHVELKMRYNSLRPIRHGKKY